MLAVPSTSWVYTKPSTNANQSGDRKNDSPSQETPSNTAKPKQSQVCVCILEYFAWSRFPGGNVKSNNTKDFLDSVNFTRNGNPAVDILGFQAHNQEPMEPTFKCLVIGDVGVGKTSFVQKYVYHEKVREYKATIGVDFALKVVKWSDTINIKLQMWDIAGQERFAQMTRVYYKNAHACILMLDVTNRESFTNALKWKRDLDSKCVLPDGSMVPCILLANKCDLRNRAVTQNELEGFCLDNGFIGFEEISVKTDRLVTESMKYLLNEIMRRYSNLYDELNNGGQESNLVHLHGHLEENQGGCACTLI